MKNINLHIIYKFRLGCCRLLSAY